MRNYLPIGRRGRLGVFVLTAWATAGCRVDAYCFDDCGPTSGGGPGAGAGGGGTGAGDTGGSGAGFVTNGGGGAGGGDCGDTQSSLENCGSCGVPCAPAGAVPVCVGGECLVQACLPGQYDLDASPLNGCEYACPVPTPDIELCDGVDNDCDGLVDSDDPDLAQPTTLCVTTPGTPCEQTQVVCNGASGWSCVYPPEVETNAGFIRELETLCDGVDGNCDGQVDEWFTALGSVCDDGGIGPCRDYGIVVCDPLAPTQTTCDLSAPPDPGLPMAEQCDGVDNDCNGFVDDSLPDAAFDMVDVPGVPGVRVDRFEASRADATSAAPGILEQVACSKPMVLPWTGGGYPEAEAACAARGAGYRLCSATELEAACRGAQDSAYPYGPAYDPTLCNGVDAAGSSAVPTGSMAMCASSPDPIYDLSGNVAEWTTTQTNLAAAPGRIFTLAGGSYLSPELGLACTIDLEPRAVESTLLPNIGFRCCKGP